MNGKLYYYYHAESDSVWKSHKSPIEEIGGAIDIDQISKERAYNLAKEMGMDEVPYG